MANLGRIVELIICVYIYVAIVRSKMKSKYNWLYRVIFVVAFVGFLWAIS